MARRDIRQHEFLFEVEGPAPFPIDMLRYDECFPASETDSARIEQSFTDSQDRPLRVLLRGGHPNAERWGSFLWRVVEVRY